MTYRSDLGSKPYLIDSSNAAKVFNQVASRAEPFSGGFIDRDYKSFPEGFYAPKYSGEVYERSQWAELMKLQDAEETSPWHVHKKNCPILNQRSLPYCWAYGPTAGIMNRYAAVGYDPAPVLSATSFAAQGKKWVKRGGWAAEAIRYIEKFGIADTEAWPDAKWDKDLPKQEEVKRSAAMHGLVEFEELPRMNFDVAMSALLDPYDSCPVTLGLSWWGHLVVALKAVSLGRNKWGMIIANSWGTGWGDKGYGVLTESKSKANEYVAIRRVKPKVDMEGSPTLAT